MNTIQSNRSGKRNLLIKLSGIPLALLLCGSVFAQPANDDCETANVILSSAPPDDYTDSVDATDATFDPNDPLLSCNAGGGGDGNQTVWWVYTPDASGVVAFDTAGSVEAGGGELDTAVGAFTGSCGALVQVGCIDAGLADALNMEVQAGTTYYIKVGQYADASDAGTIDMTVEEGVPPREPAKLVIESSFHGTSAPLKDIVGTLAPETLAAARAARGLESVYEVPNFMKADGQASKSEAGISGSKVAGSGKVKWNGPADLLQVFQGGVNDDNWDVLGTLIAPPDTVGDVGKNHYVQMFNLLTEIFDKDGNSVLGPFPTSAFFAGMSGKCAHQRRRRSRSFSMTRKPIVGWCPSSWRASRTDSASQSQTGDPTGSLHQYEFDFTGIGFPDYPKYGFATGAVNVMVNLFTPFQGSALGAIDKAETVVRRTRRPWCSSPAARPPNWPSAGFRVTTTGRCSTIRLPTFFTNLGSLRRYHLTSRKLRRTGITPENTGLELLGDSGDALGQQSL